MARRRRGGSVMRRARAETELRYGPELRGIAGLLREAQGERRSAVRQATATGAGIQRATREAVPETRGVYREAERSFGESTGDIKSALGAGYAGSAAQREAAGAGRRLAESKAGALAELSARGVDAEAAAQYGISQARTRFMQDRKKISAQARDLESEMGQYLATTYRDLADAERTYRQEQHRIRISERDSRRLMRSTVADITGVDPQTGRPTAVERGRRASRRTAAHRERRLTEESNKPDQGPSSFTPTQRRGYRNDFQQAVSLLRADPKWNPRRAGQFVDALVGKKGIPREIAQAAAQHVAQGGVGPRLRRVIRNRYGFSPPPRRQTGVLGDVTDTIGNLIG